MEDQLFRYAFRYQASKNAPVELRYIYSTSEKDARVKYKDAFDEPAGELVERVNW